jgi:hypothetical protein
MKTREIAHKFLHFVFLDVSLRRVALHKFDPPDMISNAPVFEEPKTVDIVTPTPITKRTQQLEEAAAKGLLVDFGQSPVNGITQMEDDGSPISVMTQMSKRSLDEEFGRSLDDDEDSDDDLL